MARDTLSIAGIAAHTAPKGLSSFMKWFWHRRSNKKSGSPRKELTYAEGVEIVRAFLQYAATHGVGELQRFTASKVPRCERSFPRFVQRPLCSFHGFVRYAVLRGSINTLSRFPMRQSTRRLTCCERRSRRIRGRSNSSAATSGGRCADGLSRANGSRCALSLVLQ